MKRLPTSAILGALASSLYATAAFAQPAPAAAPLPPAVPPDAPIATEVLPQTVPERDNVLKKAFAVHPGGLTAEQVAQRAVSSSTELRERQADLEAAAARVDAAMVQFFPRVSLGATYVRLSPVTTSLGGAIVGAANAGPLGVEPCPGGMSSCVVDAAGQPVGAAAFVIETALNNYSLRAALSVPISDYVLKISSSMAATRENRAAAELNREATRLEVAANARVAFYNWTRGLGQVAVAEDSLLRTKTRLAEARTTFRLGTSTQADVLRLEAMVAGTEAAIEGARAFTDVAAEQLRIITATETPTFQLGEDILDRDVPLLAPDVPLASLIARAQARRLELRALAATQRSLQAATTVTNRSKLPRLEGFADYTYANPNTRTFPQTGGWSGAWQAGASLTWTYTDALAAGASSRELTANTERVAAQLKALRNGVRLEVTQSYLDLRRARAALAAAKRAQEASEAAYKVASSLYRFGKATTTDLIGAEGELVNAQLQRINAQIDLIVADVRLRHATGSMR